jgi:hypothetical protein
VAARAAPHVEHGPAGPVEDPVVDLVGVRHPAFNV